MKDINHDEAMASMFKDDPEYATQYFNELLKTGTQQDWSIAIRQLKLSGLQIIVKNHTDT